MPLFQTKTYGKASKRIIFLMGGWTYTMPMLSVTATILAQNGFRCICYVYDNDVFSPNIEKTIHDLTKIKKKVLKQIEDLKQAGYTDFSIFGTSLGTVLSVLISNESPDIKKMILNTTGSDMAETVWSWDKNNKSFKQQIQAQHITFDELYQRWKPVSIIRNAGKLQHKKILIYFAKNDTTIPYALGEKLLKKFEEYQYDVTTVTNNHLSHSKAGLKNLLNAHIYLNFLKN